MKIKEKLDLAVIALRRIQEREWPAGDEMKGSRHASEMWEIADDALSTLSSQHHSTTGE
jgi:hypothetical protein